MIHSSTTDSPLDKARRRLMRGFAEAIKDKGYAGTSVLSIVGHAGVSKRTFYEHFADKEACLIACYLEGSTHMIRRMTEAIDSLAPWRVQVRQMVGTYLEVLQINPVMIGTVFLEIQAASGRILPERRQVNQNFVDALLRFSTHLSQQNAILKPLSPQAALFLAGGVNQLILIAAEDQAMEQVSQLEDGIVEMVCDLMIRTPLPPD